MLNKLQTQRALQDFVNEVVKNSKAELQSKGKKASGDLIRSIKGDVKAYPNSIETFSICFYSGHWSPRVLYRYPVGI